jgi:uncharacterized protein YjiS (DUF1127 family)
MYINCVAERDLNAQPATDRTKPNVRIKIMSLRNLASNVRSSWDRYQSFRSSIRELRSLDDRQLADIGVDRTRITEVARASVF